jgi:penicillin-binding protein 1A
MARALKKGSDGGWKRRLLAIGGLLIVGLAAGATGGAMGAWRTVCYDCPSIAQLYTWEPRQSTRILSHDGSLLDELAFERRTPVDIDSLPPHVRQAFIAVEDKRFYGHQGYDIRGYLRAMRDLVTKRRIAGGGSTITLQLARHMFIEELGFDRSFRRKLKELHVAVDLERVYTKDQILEAYINQVNYDQGWYGIESAAQNYFGKGAPELNPAEAAMLAAVINRPAHFNPLKNPERALQRRNMVLELMANQDYLSRAEAARWMDEPLPESRANQGAGEVAPYFVEWVRRTLEERFGSDLYSKGYRVYTTLDVEMQRHAQAAMERGWARVEGAPGFRGPRYGEPVPERLAGTPGTHYLQGMFVAVDPYTGEVKAFVGGRDFGDSKFNRATQARRQPGSVFKPFVFAAAVGSGIPVSRTILDTSYNVDLPDGTVWSPSNFTNDFRGPTTLRNALRQSVNVVAVKLGEEVGLETVAQYARRMGISTTIPRVPSLPIGTPSVLPIDIVEAYTSFATLGEKVSPRPILRVEDSEGRVIWESQPERERVIEDRVAYIVNDLLRDAVDTGTGHNIRAPGVGNVSYALPVAGKTGTTNDGTDVWFAGYTPDLVAVVWLGFDNPRNIVGNATGGGYAAPIWADFIRPVYFGRGGAAAELETGELRPGALRPIPAPWSRPEGLTTATIDRQTGKLLTEWCPEGSAREEVFLAGTEPTELCDVHAPGLFGAPMRGIRGTPVDPPDTLRRRPDG